MQTHSNLYYSHRWSTVITAQSTVVTYCFLKRNMKHNGLHWQQMTAVVAVAAANGAVCSKVRLYDTGWSLCSMALPKWASRRYLSQSWPFEGPGEWEWAACCFYSAQTPWLITLGNHKRPVSRENFRPVSPSSFSSVPALCLYSRVRVKEDKLLYFMSACMSIIVCVCVYVCQDPLPHIPITGPSVCHTFVWWLFTAGLVWLQGGT